MEESLQIEERLHAADAEDIEQTLLELAMEHCDAAHGGLFLVDENTGGLVLVAHVVDNVNVTLPGSVPRKAGIAYQSLTQNRPYLCNDTGVDEHYTRYLLDVGSIVCAPIRYQQKPIGVISVSSRSTHKFSDDDCKRLGDLAGIAATFLRRAQLDRVSREKTGRPFLIKGLSPEWREVERKIERVSPTDAPVLVRGESGTGKDLVSRAIHFNSRRVEAPYITVNCAAIPENMLESMLFGHVKGAFTGASFDKIGEFTKADGGTLFLDEVGELPLLLQAKVLRAVEQGEVQPLGSNQPPRRVDVRLVCATNRDLAKMAKRGKFREDLYFRLSVLTVELPPLRRYKDNLEVLAHVFIQQASDKYRVEQPRLSSAAMRALAAHKFPGNVRELRNAIEHAVIMSRGGYINAEDLPEQFQSESTKEKRPKKKKDKTLRELREEWLAPLEREYLLELLDQTGGNVREAASVAGVNHVTFYRLLRKHEIELRREAVVK